MTQQHDHENDPAHEHGHSHGHQQHHFDQAFWDERYGSTAAVWSGNPNPQLVREVADLPTGRALDVGAGEGADAVWLAQQGWDVVGLDVSPVALEKAASHAAAVGAEVAARIEWRQGDLLGWEPEDERFDLVTAHFMHLPADLRRQVFPRLAQAVAPGGRLLVVGHHPADHETVRKDFDEHFFYTGDDLLAELDLDGWDVETNTAPEREMLGADGEPVTIRDTVLRVRRP
ncbi:class I SAM-dependent methyltransferase [Oerskovia enterophila]|uniref:Methyltransferase YcgJ n=1 Tax=Oerskovia enterophila TaxID=43678 RepID=A0ABX2Y9G7_9CELL|nr:class I SAM-dependent methyltransferase [Oerskovia enterophila]OCI33140.1 putative methyltransferase YcgJ [Oerskovia enterophila]